jgi:hypothetical protein
MKVKEKEPEDQPWIEKILSERWGFLLYRRAYGTAVNLQT